MNKRTMFSNNAPYEGVTYTEPHQTIPDQSLTLRELLTNFTRGQGLPEVNKTPAFFDEQEFIPNIKKMDLVDIQELMETNAKKAGELQHKLNTLTNPQISLSKEREGGANLPKANSQSVAQQGEGNEPKAKLES